MHERGLAEKIFRMSLRQAEGKTISKIFVRVGELKAVEPESLKFWFDAIARDNNMDVSELEVEEVPVSWGCSYCGREYDPDSPTLICSNCGSKELTMVSGEELEVSGVE
jgi:hydrogenase nickel incorporation protein HypA/HybF